MSRLIIFVRCYDNSEASQTRVLSAVLLFTHLYNTPVKELTIHTANVVYELSVDSNWSGKRNIPGSSQKAQYIYIYIYISAWHDEWSV